MKFEHKGTMGFTHAETFDEAVIIARGFRYTDFILDGVTYVLFDGKFRKVEK